MLKKISASLIIISTLLLSACNSDNKDITIESLVKGGSIEQASEKVSQDELFVVMYDYQLNNIKPGRTVGDAIKDFEKKYDTKVITQNVNDYKQLYLRDVASYGGMKLLVEQMPTKVSSSMQYWLTKASQDKYLTKDTMMKYKLTDFIAHCEKTYGFDPNVKDIPNDQSLQKKDADILKN